MNHLKIILSSSKKCIVISVLGFLIFVFLAIMFILSVHLCEEVLSSHFNTFIFNFSLVQVSCPILPYCVYCVAICLTGRKIGLEKVDVVKGLVICVFHLKYIFIKINSNEESVQVFDCHAENVHTFKVGSSNFSKKVCYRDFRL